MLKTVKRCVHILKQSTAAVTAGVLALSGGASAQDVYSFGDSLSDTGNVRSLTFGLAAGDEYFNGRFSNGFVWNDYISFFVSGELQRTNPGLIGPFASGRRGPYNFAHGGAVSGSNGLNFEVILGGRVQGGLLEAIPAFRLTDQAEHFRDARFFFRRTFSPSSNDFATISAGGNDYFNLETDVSFVVGNIISSINTIRQRGVRRFIVQDLPLVGEIPARENSPNRALLNNLSVQHNALLRTEAARFAQQTGVEITIIPVGALFDLIRADAANGGGLFGFTVVGAGPGTTGHCLGDNLILGACPSTYAFYDDIHPTARAQSIIGNLAISALLSSASSSSASASRSVGLEQTSLSQNRILSGRLAAAQAGFTGNAFFAEGIGFGAAAFTQGAGLLPGGFSFTNAGGGAPTGPRAGQASFYRYVDGQAPEYFAVDPGNNLDPENLNFSLNLQGGEYVTGFGSDVFLSEKFLIGGLFTMSRRNNDQLRLDSDDRSDNFSVYGAYFDGPLSVSFSSRAARVDQSFVRQTGFSFAPTVSGRSQSRLASMRVDGNYVVQRGRFSLGAHAKASVSQINHQGFEERGGLGLLERRLGDERYRGAAGYLGLSTGVSLRPTARFASVMTVRGGVVASSSSDVGIANVLDTPGLVNETFGEESIFFTPGVDGLRETLAAHAGLSLQLAGGNRFSLTADADAITGNDTRAVARMNAVFRF